MARGTDQTSGAKYHFGDFQLDTTEGVVRQSGDVVSLTPKAVQALELLVANAGRVVSRSEMVESLWPDSDVEESNLTVTISVLRRALGDHESGARFIETVPKRGYRFLPRVRVSRSARPGTVTFSSMQIDRKSVV